MQIEGLKKRRDGTLSVRQSEILTNEMLKFQKRIESNGHFQNHSRVRFFPVNELGLQTCFCLRISFFFGSVVIILDGTALEGTDNLIKKIQVTVIFQAYQERLTVRLDK